MRKRGSFKRLRADTISLCRLVRKYPSTLVYPLLVLAVILGVGVWGVTRVAQADCAGAKARAASLATGVASSLLQQVLLPASPLQAVAALVRSNVSYGLLDGIFDSFVRDLTGKIPGLDSVQLAPAGVVRRVYPPGSAANDAGLGTDIFAEPSARDGALQEAAGGSLTLRGPMALRPGGRPGMRARLPIFVATAGGEEGAGATLGLPDPLNPLCGGSCYHPETGMKFWGFATAEFHFDGVQGVQGRGGSDGGSSSGGSSGGGSFLPCSLSSLEGRKYRYRLLAPAAPPGLRLLAAGGSAPVQPQEAVIELPGSQWLLQLSPENGSWQPDWYGPVVAALVLLAVAMAGVLFATLVSRRQHKDLLEALLPRELIRELVGGGAAYMGPRIMQADTPADILLKMMGALLEGGSPDLRDVLLVRTSVLRNLDIYQPLNLTATLQGANLDADVTRALMRQLGTLPQNDMVYGNKMGEHAAVQMQLEGEEENTHGAARARVQPQPPDISTLAGALALILTPHPAAWYDTGADVHDAASDAALPTADTECLLPSPLASLAAVSFGGGGGGGGGSGLLGLGGPAAVMATGASMTYAAAAMSQRQLSLNASTLGTTDSAFGDAGHRQTREPSTLLNPSVLRGSTSGFSPLGSLASFMSFGQPLRAATPPSCTTGATQAAAASRSLPSAAATAADQLMSTLSEAAAAADPSNESACGGGGGGNAASTSPLAGVAAATVSNILSNSNSHNIDGSSALLLLPLQQPPLAVTPALLATQGSSRMASNTPPSKSPLGVSRPKRGGGSSGSAAAAAAAASGLMPPGGGGGGSPFCLSATFSGSLSVVQLTAALQEERPSNRMEGLALGAGSLVMGPGGGAGGSGAGRGGDCGGGGSGGRGTAQGMLQLLNARLLAAPPPRAVIEEVEGLLAQADSWQFNTWKLREASCGHPLSTLGFYLMQRAGLIQRFKISPVTLARLLRHIEAGYPDNPYHNATHAADVLQTLHVIIHGAQLHVHYLDQLGLLAAYFAAIIHDYGHPGMTNDFLIATSDPLAVRYNDRSPLENHHAASAFSVLRRPELDVTASLTHAERTAFRKQVIDLVLATDMKQHFAVLSHFNTVHRLAAFTHGASGGAVAGAGPAALTAHRSSRSVLSESERSVVSEAAPRPQDDTERLLGLQIAMKAADLGHLGEELEVHQRWLGVLEEEFFNQGDRERQLGIPISPLFDRAKQGVGKSQVGFYDFVALPLVHALSSAFPGTQPLMRCFTLNYNHWRSVDGTPAPAVTLSHGGSGKNLQTQPRQPLEPRPQQQQQQQQQSHSSHQPAASALPSEP